MKALAVILFFIAIALMSSCASPPTVIQGEVVRYDGGNQTMAVRDETAPGTTLEFSLEGAEVGAKPNPGDNVRIAYFTKGDKLIATRIMNISQQKELKTGK
jgi:hypothetical protein